VSELASGPSADVLPWGLGTLRRTLPKQRPAPGLPHLAVLRPQVFSTSRRFDSASSLPTLFHVGDVRGFGAFRGFPLPLAATSLDAPAPHAIARSPRRTFIARLQGLMHAEGPFTSGRCYPGSVGRSSLDLCPSEGLPSRLGLVLPRRLLSWALASRWTEVHRIACSAECQRTRA